MIKSISWNPLLLAIVVSISCTYTHCFVLTLVGAKQKSDFQVHLDIQNPMLVLISNLHKFNKIFSIPPIVLLFCHDINFNVKLLEMTQNTYFWKMPWLLVKWTKDTVSRNETGTIDILWYEMRSFWVFIKYPKKYARALNSLFITDICQGFPERY